MGATTNTTIISQKAHRRAVLRRQLPAETLRERLAHLPAIASSRNPQELIDANAALLWHMAHCPRAEDRAMAWGLAEEFESGLPQPFKTSGIDYFDIDTSPLPRSPFLCFSGVAESSWLERVIPDCEIDWVTTFNQLTASRNHPQLVLALDFLDRVGLLPKGKKYYITNASGPHEIGLGLTGQRLEAGRDDLTDYGFLMHQLRTRVRAAEDTLFLILEGTVPSYKDFRVTQAERDDTELGFDCMRLALGIRNRTVGHVDLEAGKKVNWLSTPDPNYVRLGGGGGEEILGFSFNRGIPTVFLALFVKNGLPIGYGVAYYREQYKYAEVDFNIFPEFRHTPSSGTLFGGFLTAISDWRQPEFFTVELDLSGVKAAAMGRKSEDEEARRQFLLRNGFLPTQHPHIMGKEA